MVLQKWGAVRSSIAGEGSVGRQEDAATGVNMRRVAELGRAGGYLDHAVIQDDPLHCTCCRLAQLLLGLTCTEAHPDEVLFHTNKFCCHNPHADGSHCAEP